jgi:acetoacetyl-[acyl-carrier protein] synthase
MTALPVIVGYGGINAAGRSSFDQGYRRMVLESLSAADRDKTLSGLAALMNLEGESAGLAERVTLGTLIRRIEDSAFDPDAAPWNSALSVSAADGGMSFRLRRRNLPETLPDNWQVRELDGGKVEVTIHGQQRMYVPDCKPFPVKAAGQLPTGFDPGALYNSRSQPRGLHMAVMGASDALNAMGIDWQHICQQVRPDQVGMYASSIFGQLSEEGLGGMLKARWLGARPTSKQVPMGLNTMPADFINAYVLGSIGHTEAVAGACATYLYNLHAAVRDITAGRRRVAIVGTSEAPVTVELLEGFMNMSALATDEAMARLDGIDNPDPRRYSRPFCGNAGFVMGESSQYTILMDDSLAVSLGADIHGAVPAVHINADGIKKSISSPGPGNYLTFARSVALARSILGSEAVQRHSLVMAHGSSTPQNRVTESRIFDRVAEAFDITDWPVCAVKAYLGHTMASASGDQLVAAIGAMRHGLVPGIKTADRLADDIYGDRLAIPLGDLDRRDRSLEAAFINAKGFGGNNATGVLLSPARTEAMLERRHSHVWREYCARREHTRDTALTYETAADRGDLRVNYRFGDGLIDEDSVTIGRDKVEVPGFGHPLSLDLPNPYDDMC